MNASVFERKSPSGDDIAVWDPFVRFFHWVVVASFAIAYVTEDDLLQLHVFAGYTVGILVVLRIGWGFVGPRHARFSDFVAPPRAVWAYLRDLIGFRSKRYLGHSPAGGAMVVALLIMLLIVTGTGLALYAARDGAGPLAGSIARDRSLARTIKEAHELAANVTLLLVGLHILGVLWASLAHGENLIRAMVTGRKQSRTP